MNIKKVLIVLMLLLTMGMGTQAASQRHRHTPQGEELVDTTATHAVEAFSDTTSVANTSGGGDSWDWDDDDEVDKAVGKGLVHLLNSMDEVAFAPFLVAIVGIIVIFLLMPLLIIIAIFYFVNKNRKQKMKLAQMAMQNGQPIPENLLNNQPAVVDDEYQKGLRQCFVGIGLAVFLGYAAGEIGFGIGALVFFIGLGKVVAAKTAGKKDDLNDE